MPDDQSQNASQDGATGALPTYLRIAESLTIDIGGGRLAMGDKLPPERQMAADHGVAVATLRKALAVLSERGLIERRHGSGNYVLGGKSNIGTYALFRLELPGGGGLPTARLLDLTKTQKPDTLPYIGSFPTGIRMLRLRYLSDIPVAVEEIWLDLRWYDENALNRRTISESLYHTYQTRLGLSISRAEDVIHAGTLPDWSPDEFGLEPGTRMILVERRAYDQHGSPCEASWTWYDPSRAQYFARIL
ncbi:GntR family transcriptional regulator [Gymnodinialimonas sp. 2305UL16-5]|uniref:GntR family transcriptional regulator n=1 Tax=Gymnodinialimonas mytili TaxID=3126503 RepID=UPI0030B014B9